jgi:hypothetical protein
MCAWKLICDPRGRMLMKVSENWLLKLLFCPEVDEGTGNLKKSELLKM